MVHKYLRQCCLLLFAGCIWNAAAQQSSAQETPILRTNTGAHSAPIRALDVDQEERYAVTAGDDKTSGVWDLASGKLLRFLRPPIGNGNDGKLFAAAITPDGRAIAVGGWSSDNDVYLFDRSSGRLMHRITGLPDVVTYLSFSPNGMSLVVGLWGRNGIRHFRSDTAWHGSQESGSDAQYDGSVSSAKFSRDGKNLATSSADGWVRIYDVSTNRLSVVRRAQPKQGLRPAGLAWSPDEQFLAVSFLDAPSLVVLKADTLERAYEPNTAGIETGSLNAITWSPNGRDLYAAGTWRRTDRLHGIRHWSEGGKGVATDHSLASNSVVGLHALRDGRVIYASTAPSWGWLERAANGFTNQLLGSALVDFRAQKSTLRLSRDASAVAFPMHNSSGLGDATVGFDLLQLQWTLPQAQWTAPSTGKAPLALGNWFESTIPTFNQRRLVLGEAELSMSGAMAPNGIGVALGTSQYVRYYSAAGIEQWRNVAPGTTWQVNVSENGRWVVAAFSDGTIRWYRTKDGAEQLALYVHPDRQKWVLWSPSGYFAAGPGAEDLIGWHLNRGKDLAADFFPVSRFRARFYRPDVLEKVIGAEDIQQAVRLADLGTDRSPRIEPVNAMLPPVVELLSPVGDVSVSRSELAMRIAVRTPSDASVLAIRIRVNGLLQAEARPLRSAANANPSAYDLTVKIPAKDSEIQIFAETRHGVSTPAVIPVKWTGEKPPEPLPMGTSRVDNLMAPKLYLLAVGMSQYRNPSYNLDFAAKDAHDFSHALSLQKGGLYRDVVTRVLTDGKATKDDVLEGLEWLKREVTSRDIGILFLAGHGLNDNAGNFYFLPHDGNPEQLLRTGIAQNDIKLALNSIAGKALFFIDSCHSGNALGTARTRGLADVNAVVNELASAENGVIVFAASTGRQLSSEAPEWGNGAFTKAVVEGLTGKADFRRTGVITHKALDFYVAERVKELTKGQQSPVSITPSGISDFPIALVRR